MECAVALAFGHGCNTCILLRRRGAFIQSAMRTLKPLVRLRVREVSVAFTEHSGTHHTPYPSQLRAAFPASMANISSIPGLQCYEESFPEPMSQSCLTAHLDTRTHIY